MEGAAAEAIRDAEASLARQQTVTAQIDLQVVTAVLNAHVDHANGTGALAQLQQDVESAVADSPDLDTPAGARSFQRYLIGKLREIRTVVEDADLDATSRAALAAALSALYASSDAAPADVLPQPMDLPADAPVQDAPVQPPAWGAAAPTAGGFPSTPPMSTPSIPDLPSGADLSPVTDSVRHHRPHDPPADVPAEPTAEQTEGSTDVVLPTGETITAPSPELANVITAAVAGTPIPEAFTRQGITVPAAGSPVAEPIDPAQLTAGDVGIFADRHALALGNGKALLDNQIQPITAIAGPGFIGWQHPPKPAERPLPVSATP
ncbi:MAG: DUF4226 domain-containing protein [Mycobacterium sp.]